MLDFSLSISSGLWLHHAVLRHQKSYRPETKGKLVQTECRITVKVLLPGPDKIFLSCAAPHRVNSIFFSTLYSEDVACFWLEKSGIFCLDLKRENEGINKLLIHDLGLCKKDIFRDFSKSWINIVFFRFTFLQILQISSDTIFAATKEKNRKNRTRNVLRCLSPRRN